MANGRRPRRVGFQQNTALDTLERVLGLGQGIAQTVQANRQRRDDRQLSYLNTLSSGYENNYSPESINLMQEQLLDYKNKNMQNMSAEALDFFNLQQSKIKQHANNLQEYDNQIETIDSLPDRAISLVQNLSDYSNLSSVAEKEEYAKNNWTNEDGNVLTLVDKETELSDIMVEYADNMQTFMGKFGNRVSKQNPYLANRYLNLENILSQAVSAFDDFSISEDEKSYLINNLKNPNAQAIKEWSGTRSTAKKFVAESKMLSFENSRKIFDTQSQFLETGYFVPFTEDGQFASDSDGAIPPIFIGAGALTKKERENRIREHYTKEGLKGDELENQVKASYDKYLGIDLARGKAYAALEKNSKFGGVDFIKDLDVEYKKYGLEEDITTTTTTTTTTPKTSTVRNVESYEDIKKNLRTDTARNILEKSNKQVDSVINYINNKDFVFGEEFTDAEIKKLTKQFSATRSQIKSMNVPDVYKGSDQLKFFTNEALKLIGKKGTTINKEEYQQIKNIYQQKANRLNELKIINKENQQSFNTLQPSGYLSEKSLSINNPAAFEVLYTVKSNQKEKRNLEAEVQKLSTIIGSLDRYYSSSNPPGVNNFKNMIEKRFQNQVDTYK